MLSTVVTDIGASHEGMELYNAYQIDTTSVKAYRIEQRRGCYKEERERVEQSEQLLTP